MEAECKYCLGRPGGVAAHSTQAGGTDGGRTVLQADPMLFERDITCGTPSEAQPRRSGEPILGQYASHGESNSPVKATARCRLVAVETLTNCVRSPRIKMNSLMAVANPKALKVRSPADHNHALDRQRPRNACPLTLVAEPLLHEKDIVFLGIRRNLVRVPERGIFC